MRRLEPIERSERERRVDIACVVLAVAWGVLSFLLDRPGETWLLVADVVLGPAAWVAIWHRRRWPVGVALALLPALALAPTAFVAALIALFTVAVSRPARTALAFAAATFTAAIAGLLVQPQDSEDPLWEGLVFLALLLGAIVAWGMYVRARRLLVTSLRQRAERAEAEQEAMALRARADERTRIAREMHDVVAHRVSLIALHAGGLELRPDAPPDEVRRSAALIGTTARQAMEDLRGALGVLRGVGASADGAPLRPQPTLADLPRLVEDSRGAGAQVELDLEVPPGVTPPEAVGRDAYRIVQEALTNVHKHARGAATTVRVSGAPGEGLAIEVRNRLPVGQGVPTLPGAGTGLVGLRERVTLAGGTIEHGPDGDEFVVRARLRWDR